MNFNTELFKKFISLECNRKDFITYELKKQNINFAILPVENKNHIYVIFPQSCYNPEYKIKTVIAHYDRIPNTFGANDNSFAVFTLLNFAKFLNNPNFCHNIRLIFTDGEEFSEGGVENQGSFSLAKTFRRLKITEDFIFVFDCMGRGNVPILAKNLNLNTKNSKFLKNQKILEDFTKKIISSANGKNLILPIPYSDNAGFLAQGLNSTLITMLPEDEANILLINLFKNPKLEDYILNNIKNLSEEEKSFYESQIPSTWKLFHTLDDNFSSLNLDSYEIFIKILVELAKSFQN